jgi:uroporphyrinogen decarboxylase
MKKIHDHVRERGVPAMLMHPCADQNANIPYYVKMREENDWSGKYVWLFGPETPIKTQIDAFGDHDVICGNINPPLFQSSTYEEVLELCRVNIEEGINAPNGDTAKFSFYFNSNRRRYLFLYILFILLL